MDYCYHFHKRQSGKRDKYYQLYNTVYLVLVSYVNQWYRVHNCDRGDMGPCYYFHESLDGQVEQMDS
jgi:hypothetical protein